MELIDEPWCHIEFINARLELQDQWCLPVTSWQSKMLTFIRFSMRSSQNETISIQSFTLPKKGTKEKAARANQMVSLSGASSASARCCRSTTGFHLLDFIMPKSSLNANSPIASKENQDMTSLTFIGFDSYFPIHCTSASTRFRSRGVYSLRAGRKWALSILMLRYWERNTAYTWPRWRNSIPDVDLYGHLHRGWRWLKFAAARRHTRRLLCFCSLHHRVAHGQRGGRW